MNSCVRSDGNLFSQQKRGGRIQQYEIIVILIILNLKINLLLSLLNQPNCFKTNLFNIIHLNALITLMFIYRQIH